MRSRQSLRLHALHSHPHFAAAMGIIRKLSGEGHQTVLAGGCVRDSLLGSKPKDLDLATAAPPEVVERSFSHTLAVGKAFGTIVVIEEGVNFEVTTFRKDGPYADGRHPIGVEFSDIEEDAKRRDFTINALFYDPVAEQVLDFVGGVEDIKRHCLRTVGDANLRFGEDRLRMLRAVRFNAQLGFAVDALTLQAIQALHTQIVSVSLERIFNEMKRMLEATYLVEGLTTLRASLLDNVIWPELKDVNLGRFADFMPLRNWENAFAAIVVLRGHDDDGEQRLRQWKAPRESIRRVRSQVVGCRVVMDPRSSRADRARVLGGEDFADVLTLARGFLDGNFSVIEGWIEEYLTITGSGGILPRPLVNGQDLLNAGILPGEKMGQLLKALYEGQLEGEFTSKEEALAKIKTL